MRHLLDLSHVTATPIQSGDAGIILKADGTFQVFSTGEIDADNMTDMQMTQGTKLLALATALRFPPIMDILIQASQDPAIVGEEVIDLASAH